MHTFFLCLKGERHKLIYIFIKNFTRVHTPALLNVIYSWSLLQLVIQWKIVDKSPCLLWAENNTVAVGRLITC